ncbi:Uncharacterised protein [Porphyromonas endodontalis]|nr:Uncharacterised protein [Porphyromonas endodontalis]
MYTTLGSPLCGSRSPDFPHRLRLNQRVEGISIDSTQYRKGSEFFVLSHFYPLVRENADSSIKCNGMTKVVLVLHSEI